MLNSLPFLSNRLKLQRGLVFGTLIITALLAFEVFNYSTTDFALRDLIGELTFLGIRWATILSIAFCVIDFAGIARLFTPEKESDESTEVWYLFGAWMLAALMNAMLTWWGVSIAILNHETLGNAVVARETLLKIVPIFVAVMVWLIRVLIIGSISMAGDRLFGQAPVSTSLRSSQPAKNLQQKSKRSIRPKNHNSISTPGSMGINASTYQQAPKKGTTYRKNSAVEPEYTPLESTQSTASLSNQRDNNQNRQIRF